MKRIVIIIGLLTLSAMLLFATGGAEAEVDWGRCQAIIGGEQSLLKLFCIHSKYSGKHFVRCYRTGRNVSMKMRHFSH